jgi:hypothetical protein
MKKNMIAVLALCISLMFSANVMAQQTNAGVGAGANANANVGSVQAGAGFQGDVGSNNTSIDNRAFAVPGNVQYGPVINYFTKPLPSEGFQPIETILMYGCWFTEGALQEMAAGGMFSKAEADVKITNAAPMAKPAAEDGKTRWIKIVISAKPVEKVNFKGFVTARATDMDSTMVQVMGKAALEAMNKGANVIHFTAQGAVRDVFSSGWGIGFGSTFAKMYDNNNSQDMSGVGYAGFGISKAKAGTRDLPWLQGFALVDDAPDYPKLPTAPAAVKAAAPADTQTGNHIPKKS